MPGFSSDERKLLDESLNDYLNDTYDFEFMKKTMRAGDGDGFSRERWAQYAEFGWLGVALPEDAGGIGGGFTELGIVMAAAGRHLLLEPFVQTLAVGATVLERLGTPDQKKALEEVAAGSRLLAFCHAEPTAGFAREHVTTIATQTGAGFEISGEKTFTLGAHAADDLIVSARVGSQTGPVALFIVPKGTDGVALNQAPGLDGRIGAAVMLSAAKVPAGARLGDGDADRLADISTILDAGMIAACAEAVGAMAAVTEMSVEYLKTREQFGQPLSKFQVLQHRLVDMSVATEEARASVHAALQALDDGRPGARAAIWRAKVQTGRSARFVGAQGVQLHGGMGMTDELAVGHYYKRLSQIEAMFGDADYYLNALAAA
jgi:alkylation response protein AidB-like acyl-CoA dehydrogenase